ncbi:hypothetical protein LTR62_003714 [Meristemomyces frigidus]|uniref:Uncharacterized protein n=1 Tax=Meristemomyces frigidus TaxID=1508187 RepID=A0AAN7YRK6_9PEZI|nr:hypothetical protein LTR62_003714 [Meristemomyces frigidus]
MARFPDFEDYAKKGNFADGIKRCDDLLVKSPNDVRLLTTQLRLMFATDSMDEAQTLLGRILALEPPVQDLQDTMAIEQAVIDSQATAFPPPTTAGPSVSKIWDNAVRGSPTVNQKHDLVATRFERAILDNRTVDAQQALIQLKALQPKNRMVYMAHAAYTQLTSKTNDDLQARLAMGLARKAIKESFDDDKALDCRVPGQIFAVQYSAKDLESIKERAFQDSKQVFDARRGAAKDTSSDITLPVVSASGISGLAEKIEDSKSKFADMVNSNANAGAVQVFAVDTINLFHVSLAEGSRRQPADACFVAISALVRLFELNNNLAYLLHAAFLAETLLQHHEHIYEARLILVYIYMRLDLGSLAMRLFDSLSIKEIQHDTVGHVLFTRLSTIHPHPTAWGKKKRDGMDPLKRTIHALGVYIRCEEKLAETEANVLSTGQTGMIFDLQGLRHSLRTSYSRRLILLEQRRIERLMQGTVDDVDAAATAMGCMVYENWMQTTDNRDFDAAFNHGYNIERVLHRRESSKPPGRESMLVTLAIDYAWCIVNERGFLAGDVTEVSRHLGRMQEEYGILGTEADAQKAAAAAGLTLAECQAGNVAKLIIDACHAVGEDSSNKDVQLNNITSLTKAIEGLDIATLISTSSPLAQGLQPSYLYTDILRTTLLAYRHFHRTSGPTTSAVQELQHLQETCKRAFAAIQKYAVEQQTGIKSSDIRQLMLSADDGVWKSLQDFKGKGRIDAFCEEMATSAREGWEGLGKIRLL